MRTLALLGLVSLAACSSEVRQGGASPSGADTDVGGGDAGDDLTGGDAGAGDAGPSDADPSDADPGDAASGDAGLPDQDSPGDAEPTDEPPPRLPGRIVMELERDLTASGFVVDVSLRVFDTQGVPFSGLPLDLSSAEAVVGAVAPQSGGRYSARAASSIASGVLRLRASVGSLSLERELLVLPQIADHWDVPELVPGLVNTPGTEDSCEVSPDGEWLLVGTYSPVDIICCLLDLPGACTDAGVDGTYCNQAIGPFAAPERPNMLGADRILSATDILHAAPNVGFATAEGGDLPFALPPVAAYGFKRQADGSFAEPFVIGLDMDGFTTAPFGFSFVGAPDGDEALVVFAWDVPHREPDTGNDLYISTLQLGQDAILGRYRMLADTPLLLDFRPTLLELPQLEDNQGNPAFGLDRLWWDSEHASADVDDLWTIHADQLDTTTPARLPQSTSQHRELMPFVDGERLYYSHDTTGIYSAALVGTDLASQTSWSEPQLELGATGLTTDVGNVVGMGEPSLAHAADGSWLYFVVYMRTETGLNGAVARVRARD